MKKNAGFTLIELVAVMLILAILAVVAVPQFVDLSDEAEQAATDGVAGALASASTLNFAQESANGAGIAVADCDDASALLQGGVLPDVANYSIDADPIAPGATVVCTLQGPGAAFATFPVIGVN